MPMLLVQVQPRESIYDSSEANGEFIVEASISYTHGAPYKNATSISGSDETEPFNRLNFDIRIEETDLLLVSSGIVIHSGPRLFQFHLNRLKPRLMPYDIVLYGGPMHEIGYQNYTASTQLFYLPAKNSGSTVKVDNLHGGMLVANNATYYAFEPLLPFGFYTSCSGYLNYSLANVSAYKDLGFNAINPVCAFTDGDLGYLFDWLDETNLWYQYDMRGSYLNLTSVKEQILLVKDRSAFLSWYTADEPDGWQYALNSTRLAYDLLKEEDPYHPTGLVLNCENYYFKEYASGADYLMEDAYPVGINPYHSRKWNTTCNETYGDCGCDNCIGQLQDVSDRLDAFFNYQEWLGEWEKPLWSVLQAFSGERYWSRDPTTAETWAMILLSFNHMAKAIMSWTFPATNTLNKAHAAIAKVATKSPVSTFLLNSEPVQVDMKGQRLLDVSYWISESQAMVGFVNLAYLESDESVFVELPINVGKLASQPWGSLSWSLGGRSNESTVLKAAGLNGLDTSILILDL
jgi:hypothetical protein